MPSATPVKLPQSNLSKDCFVPQQLVLESIALGSGFSLDEQQSLTVGLHLVYFPY